MKLRSVAYATVVAVASVMLVLGTMGTSEAKGKKKKAAPPPPPPVICTLEYKPVCAVKGGLNFTYSNACFAVKDGAKVVSQGACKAKKAKKAKKAAKKAAKKK